MQLDSTISKNTAKQNSAIEILTTVYIKKETEIAQFNYILKWKNITNIKKKIFFGST